MREAPPIRALRPLDLLVPRGISLVHGSGCTLYDSEGRSYLDLASNYGVNVLGHGHPAVTRAITAQAARLTNAHQSFDTPARDDFLLALGRVLPPELARVCFVNTGAEAVEVAIKMARAATGRVRLVAFHRAYHGRTCGALSLTASARYRDPFAPLLADVVHLPYDDLAALEEIDETVAAVVVEPIQGEAGVRIPSAGFLAALANRSRAAGALLVTDEVQTGLRTGAILASEHEGVIPDIVCLGKGIAGGLPMAVTVCTESVATAFPRGGHGSTFAGNPLVCAAGAATLGMLADAALHVRVRAAGRSAIEDLRVRLPAAAVREVRGRGLLIAIELRRPAAAAILELQRRGILVLPAGRTVIRLLPPLIIEPEVLAAATAEIAGVITASV